jgi:hypothetical protein
MAGAEESRADVFPAPHEIARGFFLIDRDVNRGQRAAAEGDRQVRRISAVGLDPVARAARNQGQERSGEWR